VIGAVYGYWRRSDPQTGRTALVDKSALLRAVLLWVSLFTRQQPDSYSSRSRPTLAPRMPVASDGANALVLYGQPDAHALPATQCRTAQQLRGRLAV
jgi:hypothetical protein